MWIKICGVTNVEDALVAVDCGADAVGVNMVPGSKRRVDDDTARTIVEAIDGQIAVVAVIADETTARVRNIRDLGVDLIQLHGHEPPGQLAELLPAAYKAVRIADTSDVALAESYAGAILMCDAKVDGALGGTGKSFDWTLVRALARKRDIVIAGGLAPENVALAIDAVAPFGVDVASGVERIGDPRMKDADRVQAFVQAARRA